MENWGLITYRETSLLYSPEESSAQAKQWIGTIHILRTRNLGLFGPTVQMDLTRTFKANAKCNNVNHV